MKTEISGILAVASVLLFCAHSSRAEYELTAPPPPWQKILETKRSFDGAASLRDFIQFIFQNSAANVAISSHSSSEFHITASFRNLTLKEILETIARDPSVRVKWGYESGSPSPQRIEIITGPIDLMSKGIDVSRYPAQVTLLPEFATSKSPPTK